MIKRAFDLVVAAIGVAVLAPVFAALAILIKLDSKGGILFRQTRMGRDFKPFATLKFRTMVDSPSPDDGVAAFADPRVTRVGRVLRATKLDELPQLFNVLKGDMSLVGPRPETPRYVNQFRAEYTDILSVRPGITDFATLAFRHESALLEGADDPEQRYLTEILPRKIELSRDYVRRASFWLDVKVLMKTILQLWPSAATGGRR